MLFVVAHHPGVEVVSETDCSALLSHCLLDFSLYCRGNTVATRPATLEESLEFHLFASDSYLQSATCAFLTEQESLKSYTLLPYTARIARGGVVLTLPRVYHWKLFLRKNE